MLEPGLITLILTIGAIIVVCPLSSVLFPWGCGLQPWRQG
jgi:hypothetical protein